MGKRLNLESGRIFFQDEQHISGSDSLTELRNVRIDIVEPLGYDRELNLKLGDQMLKARLDLRTEAQEGETINLCFDMNRAHIFDIESEENLTI